ncbi:hypothetical protein [Polaromonas sp.]|uniref:hypothetical protein n=1 Tax=Polaromonas sp. TaxID=1869339 RepID=UPI0017AA0FB6|nr:hypothetical protein [Polaromonas sp.]NML85868.1 hypothetical protein [Polaromonas sp.]
MTRGLLLGISSGAHMKARPRCSFTLATVAIKGERAAAMPHGSPLTRVSRTLVVVTSVLLPSRCPRPQEQRDSASLIGSTAI